MISLSSFDQSLTIVIQVNDVAHGSLGCFLFKISTSKSVAVCFLVYFTKFIALSRFSSDDSDNMIHLYEVWGSKVYHLNYIFCVHIGLVIGTFMHIPFYWQHVEKVMITQYMKFIENLLKQNVFFLVRKLHGSLLLPLQRTTWFMYHPLHPPYTFV